MPCIHDSTAQTSFLAMPLLGRPAILWSAVQCHVPPLRSKSLTMTAENAARNLWDSIDDALLHFGASAAFAWHRQHVVCFWHARGEAMYRRILVLCLITSCLSIILAACAGVWGIRHGLIQGPVGTARLGQVEVMAFTSVEYSTARPPHGYYTVWIGLEKDAATTSRPWRPLLWAHRLVRLEVPPPAVLMP